MAHPTNSPPHTNRMQQYVIIGLACTIGIAVLVVYQNMDSKVQTPDQSTPALTSQDQSAQTVKPSSTPEELGTTKDLDLALLEQDIHKIANQERESNGVQPITYDSKLAGIARAHSQDMAAHQFLSHSSYDGGHDLNYRYMFAGYDCKAKAGSYGYSTGNENIAPVINQGDELQIAQHIVNTWMDSVADRYNILDSQHQTEGIGVALTGNKMVVYATDDFC